MKPNRLIMKRLKCEETLTSGEIYALKPNFQLGVYDSPSPSYAGSIVLGEEVPYLAKGIPFIHLETIRVPDRFEYRQVDCFKILIKEQTAYIFLDSEIVSKVFFRLELLDSPNQND